jgi:hypothetical protein
MTDLELVILAARRNADAIRKSAWVGERERSFMSNAFDAFADELRDILKDRRDAAPLVTAKMSENGVG